MEIERLFAEFRDAYAREVQPLALELLLGPGVGSGRRRAIAEPVHFTLEARRNFFRTGFALAAGEAVEQRATGRLVAAVAEIGWTCALMLDDMLDGSCEREGHQCAHCIYGAPRTIVSILSVLAVTAAQASTVSEVQAWPKVQLELLGLSLLARAMVVQAPWFARPHTTLRYRLAAREMNNSTHWAMVAPLRPYAPRSLQRVVWAYADALTVMGKISNDVADYVGGSTESSSLHKDFASRTPTFPVLLLLDSPLPLGARRRIERHFIERHRSSDLGLQELLEQLERSSAFERCYETIERQERVARRCADASACLLPTTRSLAILMDRWIEYVMVCTRERLGLHPRHQLTREIGGTRVT